MTNICRLDENIGDLQSSPVAHLKEFSTFERRDILTAVPGTGPVIFGGGGMLHFNELTTNLLLNWKGQTIGWGIGHNTHNGKPDAWPEYLKSFNLLGIRDWNSPFEWVPCASCLSPHLNEPTAPWREAVFYGHYSNKVEGVSLPSLANNEKSLSVVVEFLSSAETVVSNSYHGIFWATLLGRKAVLVEPFSSKFYGFRHPPVFSTMKDWKSASADCGLFPSALSECREANLSFAARALKIIAGCPAAGTH